MRVLYISAWFPYPPDNGARIRSYYMMKELARTNEVHLISLLQDDSDPADTIHLADICHVVSLHPSRWFKPGTFKSALGFFSPKPRSVVDTYDQSVARAVREAAMHIKPDVIVASSLGVAVYVPHDLGVPTVLDEHNCEFAILKRSAERAGGHMKRLRLTLGWKKAARWEACICRKFNCITMVSEQDRDLLLESAAGLPSVEVIPNGVDTSHYSPDDRQPQPNSLLYNGALTYSANLDAVRIYASDIYPLLRHVRSDAKLRVTGRISGVDLTGIDDCPGVELTGYVDDIRTVLRSSAVCIVPLRQGGGSRLKILEAMAAGVPVVSTSIGAEGLDAINGTHMLIADSPQHFADAINSVLNDPALADSLSQQGRRLVEDKYSWATIGAKFAEIVGAQV